MKYIFFTKATVLSNACSDVQTFNFDTSLFQVGLTLSWIGVSKKTRIEGLGWVRPAEREMARFLTERWNLRSEKFTAN